MLAVFTSSCDLLVYNLADVHGRQLEEEEGKDKTMPRESLLRKTMGGDRNMMRDSIKRRTYGNTMHLKDILQDEIGEAADSEQAKDDMVDRELELNITGSSELEGSMASGQLNMEGE